MNNEWMELLQKVMVLTGNIGELKGELKAVKEENAHLRELLKNHIEPNE